MTLEQMISLIHVRIKSDCFTDLVEITELSSNTINKWRNQPPQKPSLHVFCTLASYCNLNPTLDQIKTLIR